MSYGEEELLPLSALQHLVFCERQCALIHIEQVWEENRLTLEGKHMHRCVHEEDRRRERRGNVLIIRRLSVRSFHLGLSGIADVVEFTSLTEAELPQERDGQLARAVSLPGEGGLWKPFPVEYKHGKPKADSCDEVQLCAQAICLEEMLGVEVDAGALFYGRLQRRHEVTFHRALRAETSAAAKRLHELIASGRTPQATRQPKCKRCSLLARCMPEATSKRRLASRYLTNQLVDLLEGEHL